MGHFSPLEGIFVHVADHWLDRPHDSQQIRLRHTSRERLYDRRPWVPAQNMYAWSIELSQT